MGLISPDDAFDPAPVGMQEILCGFV